MGLISDGTTIFDAGAMSLGGSMVLIKKIALSSAASTVSFVNGASDVVLDGTYKQYIFTLTNIHPSENNTGLTVGFRDGGSAYDATKTSNCFYSYHSSANTSLAAVEHLSSFDLQQATGNQTINNNIGAGAADECLSGELWLFNPSSTTFVKHYMIKTTSYHGAEQASTLFIGGYCNVTAAIDGVKFIMASGNIDAGKIKLYGIKDS